MVTPKPVTLTTPEGTTITLTAATRCHVCNTPVLDVYDPEHLTLDMLGSPPKPAVRHTKCQP